MEEQLLLCQLYDYYEPLLTDKQKKYFTEYYFDNLTLAELSEIYDVSRNAIHKTLKEVQEKLVDYEDKLKLFQKKQKLEKIIVSLDSKLKEQILENI